MVIIFNLLPLIEPLNFTDSICSFSKTFNDDPLCMFVSSASFRYVRMWVCEQMNESMNECVYLYKWVVMWDVYFKPYHLLCNCIIILWWLFLWPWLLRFCCILFVYLLKLSAVMRRDIFLTRSHHLAGNPVAIFSKNKWFVFFLFYVSMFMHMWVTFGRQLGSGWKWFFNLFKWRCIGLTSC